VIDESSVNRLFDSSLFLEPRAHRQALRSLLGQAARSEVREDLEDTATSLESLYSNPPRAYHVLGHALEVARRCLVFAESVAESTALDLPALIVAALCHDAVYEKGRSDNELRSAGVARATARVLGLAERTANMAGNLVLATLHPAHFPGSIGEAIIRDADLAILASPPQRYANYAALIRVEASALGDMRFHEARGRFLKEFLGRDKLFYLEGWAPLLEERARKNLAAELASIEGKNRKNEPKGGIEGLVRSPEA